MLQQLAPLLIIPQLCSALPPLWKEHPTLKSKQQVLQRVLELKNDERPECWSDINPRFLLFTKGPEELSSLTHVAVLLHGFRSGTEWAEEMAEVVVQEDRGRKRMGAVVVDWREGSGCASFPWGWQTCYTLAVANTRCVAEATSLLLQQEELPLPSVHCIGHSLGAHACGFLANHLKATQGAVVERISGLDPAGIDWTTRLVPNTLLEVEPMETPLLEEDRLDASDAALVDIYHTDGDFAGTMLPMGHVDFYVGRSMNQLGASQQGCGCDNNCDHSSADRMFLESMRKPLTVSKMLRCQCTTSSTLGNCTATRQRELAGYFYRKEDGLRGAVGVLMESDAVEDSCMGVKETKNAFDVWTPDESWHTGWED